ncbi:MAG: hypothetical protein K0R50_2024, partial [Eubacterium sp.]|nr:hypothetical protein [Eubacterium sp.]
MSRKILYINNFFLNTIIMEKVINYGGI